MSQKVLKVGLSSSERTTINNNAVAAAEAKAQTYLDNASATVQAINILDESTSKQYSWQIRVVDGKPQLVYTELAS